MTNRISKILSVSFMITFLVSSAINAQPELKSIYLQNPDTIIPFILESADFWKKSVDWDDGGFYTEVNRDGTPEITTRKSFVQCSRHAYGFSRAFMVSGDETYLDYANHAMQFVYDYGWDTQYGGWFMSSDKKGNLATPFANNWNPNSTKWSFQQHYDVLGISALAEATRDSLHQAWFDRSVTTNDQQLWDDREGYEGFYGTADADWSNKSGKGFTPTVDAITTWVLSRALLTNNDEDVDRMIALADNIMDNLYASMFLSQVNLGFLESYSSNWDLNEGSTGTSTGHVIKTAWCLARAYMLSENPEYLEAAQYMINDIMNNGGYDYDQGGLYSDFNWSTGDVDKRKNHWMLEQGLTSGLINYYLADDPDDKALNLSMADGCMDFYMNHFIDNTYGECYLATNEVGVVINNDKSDPFKGGYHNIEMAYFAYVYGNLFLQKQPVNLYYRFEKSITPRMITMSPIASVDEELKIIKIELDGEAFNNFDKDSREVSIPAGTGGIFKITYEMDEEKVATNTIKQLVTPEILPNPSHNYLSIKGVDINSEIKIFSIEGKVILAVHNFMNGDRIDISKIPRGIYVINIKSNGIVWNQKVIIQ